MEGKDEVARTLAYKLLDAAGLITVVGVIAYVLGAIKVASYWRVMGYPSSSLNLPTTTYLLHGEALSYGLIAISGGVVALAAEKHLDASFKRQFANAITILAPLYGVLIVISRFGWLSRTSIYVAIAGLALLFGIIRPIFTFRKRLVADIVWNSSKPIQYMVRAIIGLFAFILAAGGSIGTGTADARAVQTGTRGTRIVLTLKEPLEVLTGQDLTLLHHGNGQYYLIVVNGPPEMQGVFVVPDDATKSVFTTPRGNEAEALVRIPWSLAD